VAGQQPSIDQINSQLTSLCIRMRELMVDVEDMFTQVDQRGADGLVELSAAQGGSLTLDQANEILEDYNYAHNVAGAYFGTAIIASLYDFDSQLARCRGGSTG
jgi:hypothetical protein